MPGEGLERKKGLENKGKSGLGGRPTLKGEVEEEEPIRQLEESS